MEGFLHSNITALPKRAATSVRNGIRRLESHFFLFFIDHFTHHVPTGNVWDSAFGYSVEVGKVMNTLARRAHANVLLVGQEGVGSLGIAKEVARLIHAAKGHSDLSGQRVLFVNMEELLGGVTPGIHQLHVIAKMLSEIEHTRNAIVVLTGMGSIFAGRYPLSAEDILHPFFSSPFVRTITILSDEEYHAHIAGNTELSHYVEVVPVRGLSAATTKEFLKDSFGSSIPHEILEEIVEKTEHLFPHIPYPKRAIDVLEEARGNNDISSAYITKSISKKLGFDIRRPTEHHVLDVPEALHRGIVNQEGAIQTIADAFTRAGSRRIGTKRPLATLLFAGPVGVGKTETANILAHTYFGSRSRVIHVDMQSYVGDLSEIVSRHPFSVLVLDGFEKASKAVQEDFLPIFSQGYGVDSYGRKYFTTHMIVVATSNALPSETCSQELRDAFDAVATFTSLTPAHVREIARRKLARLNARLQMEHDVSLEVPDELLEYVAKEGYSEAHGARRMDLVIEDTVEYAVGEMIRKGTLVSGQRIFLDPRQF